MLHVGASGCVHIVAVDMSGPAKISAEGKNCAEVLHSLSEGDNMCTGVQCYLLRANIGCHEVQIYTHENRTNIGRYNTENGPARATRHLAVPKSQTQL